MDIKTRINELTEAEAKAALYYLLENNAENLATPFENELQYEREINVHMSYILDDALKEAQHGHKGTD